MKKVLSVVLSLMLLFCLCGCQDIKDIKINTATIHLKSYNDNYTLVATAEPTKAKIDVNWSSSDTTVASVYGGKVFAKGNGKCEITATSKDGQFSAKCPVEVDIIKTENAPTGYYCFDADNFNIFYPLSWQNSSTQKGMNTFSVPNTSQTFNIFQAKTSDNPFETNLETLKKQFEDNGLNVVSIALTEATFNEKKFCLITIDFLNKESVYQYSYPSLINKDKFVHIISFNGSVKSDIVDTVLNNFVVKNAF